jgi:Tfp pilus assembly PilM family ATPase/Tfp pilus assembly protein PilN
MTVTLNIDSQSIRLLSYRANQVELWETLDLPPGVIKDGLILDPPLVANLLKEHFQTFKLPPQQVKVCLTGLSFIYRVLILPNLKTKKLRSAVERATQKEITLPLENLYLDWQIINQTDRDLEIFVMGIARQMVDVLLTTLKLAGISLQSLELKAVALARAAIHKNALVVDCEPAAFEILVIREGVPVTIYRVSPKNGMSTLEDNLNQMLSELNRTIDYYNLNHPKNLLTQTTPVMLSGSLCEDKETCQAIVQRIGHNVEFFNSPLNLPPDFPILAFAANLGLLYQSQPHSKSKTPDSIDLIQARRRALSHPLPIKNVVLSGILAGALLLLALVWMTRQQAANQSASLLLKADRLNQELHLANQQLQQANQIQTQITALTGETEMIQTERLEMTGKGELASILTSITQNLPPGTVFTKISSQPNKITIDGLASGREAIVNYIYCLEKQGSYSEVRIALIDANPDQSDLGNSFRIVIER